MALVDIGGGLKQFTPDNVTPVDQVKEFSSLVDLVDKIKQAPIALASAKADLARKQLELSSKALFAAATGDLNSANEVIKTLRPGSVLEKHPDPLLAKQGFFLERNPVTGATQDLDAYAELKFKEQISLQADLVKQATGARLRDIPTRRALVMSIAKKFSENQQTPDLRGAVNLANDFISGVEDMGNPGKAVPFPQIGSSAAVQPVPLEQVPKQFVENRLQAGAELEAARNIDNPDRLSGVTLKTGRIPTEIRKQLVGLHSANKSIGIMVSALSDLNKLGIPPDLIQAPIQSIMEKFNKSDPRFLLLKSLSTKAKMEEMLRLSGTQYTDRQYEALSEMFPKPTDNIEIAVAKLAMFMAQNSTNANSVLESAEASGFGGVENQKKLFFGQNDIPLNADSTRKNAVVLLNSIPKDILASPEMLSLFMKNLPTVIRTEIESELSSRGTPVNSGIMDRFNKILGK